MSRPFAENFGTEGGELHLLQGAKWASAALRGRGKVIDPCEWIRLSPKIKLRYATHMIICGPTLHAVTARDATSGRAATGARARP